MQLNSRVHSWVNTAYSFKLKARFVTHEVMSWVSFFGMKQIIVTEPGSISPQEKEKLKDTDIIIIEAVDPKTVRVIRSFEGFELDGVAGIAIKAIAASSHSTNKFGELMVLHLSQKPIK